MALLLGSAFFSCIDEVGKQYTAAQLNRLLNADDAKYWLRFSKTEDGNAVDIDDCDNHQMIVFYKAVKKDDPNTLVYFNRAFNCESGDNMIEFLSSEYELLTADDGVVVDQIVLSNTSNTAYTKFEILNLTSVQLSLKYKLSGVEIIETFESSH